MGLVACGQNQPKVTDGSVRSFTENEEVWGEVKLTVTTGGIQIPGFSYDIQDPADSQKTYGTLALTPTIGASELTLKMNVTQASLGNTLEPLLPNGNALPVGGIDEDSVIALPVDGGKALVYLSLSNNRVLVGSAVPIKEFDVIGNKLGTIGLFPGFTLTNGLEGIIGIFSGSESKTSGIAFFLDATSILGGVLPQNPSLMTHQTLLSRREISFNNGSISKRKMRKLRYWLWRLQQKKVWHPAQ